MKVQDTCCEPRMILLPDSVSENPEGQTHKDEAWRSIKGWWRGAVGDGWLLVTLDPRRNTQQVSQTAGTTAQYPCKVASWTG